MSKILNTKEMCEYLNTNIRNIYNWVRNKNLPAIKNGRLFYFDLDKVNKWAKNNKIKIGKINDDEIEEFRYNILFRKENPSIFRLAYLQLLRERVDLSNRSKDLENWNLLLDRAVTISKSLSTSSRNSTKDGDSIRQLHKRLLNV